MAHAHAGVVLEAAAGQPDHLVLHVGDLADARAAEEGLLDGIVGELRLGGVDDDLAVLGLAVGEGGGESLDAALVAAPAGAGIGLVEHLVVGDGALAGHQALGHRTAVEEDDLVLLVAVVVVPVEHGGGLLGGQGHGPHGDGGAHIDLAGGRDAAVVELGEQHTGADAQHLLHLVPAAQGQRVQVVLLDVAVDGNGDLGQGILIALGHLREVGVVHQVLLLRHDLGIVVGHVLHLEEELGEVKGLHVDAVLLHGDLVKAGGLEGGGAGADAAQVEALHAVDHAADGREVPQVLLKFGRKRMHHMGLEHREGHAVLGEHVGDGEFAAEGVAPVLEVHLADFVGIGLHENGHARVLKGGDGAVFVGEDGHGENHAVVFALVLFEPLGVEQALVPGLDAAVAGQARVHGDVVVARVGDGLDHVVPRAVDQFPGHKAAVAKCQSKGHFLGHN